ncbi:hypothetical protein K438DRAFT_1854171 [Mycena galopus ATCC 62051]|nr:hypothetical protein K438DRAFT_1854171 [Mycena galopus ATCC 62051]
MLVPKARLSSSPNQRKRDSESSNITDGVKQRLAQRQDSTTAPSRPVYPALRHSFNASAPAPAALRYTTRRPAKSLDKEKRATNGMVRPLGVIDGNVSVLRIKVRGPLAGAPSRQVIVGCRG